MAAQARDVGEIASKSFEFMVKLTRDVGNLILLIVLNLIPIVNFIVLGYFVRVVRRDASEPPKLGDYGALFVEGLKLVLAALIYMLIPLAILIVALIAAGAGWALIGLFLRPRFHFHWALVLALLALLLLLVILFLATPVLAIYMRTGDFSKVFAFGEGWDLVSAFGLGNYVLLLVLLLGFDVIAYAVGSLLPWVGPAVVGVFAMAFTFKAVSLFVNVKYPPSA